MLSVTNLSIFGARGDQRVVEGTPTATVSAVESVCGQSYQSVSNTAAVCPLNNGICSGNRPFSLIGITAKAPPPLASQLTEI